MDVCVDGDHDRGCSGKYGSARSACAALIWMLEMEPRELNVGCEPCASALVPLSLASRATPSTNIDTVVKVNCLIDLLS